jgi:hypothetical protein
MGFKNFQKNRKVSKLYIEIEKKKKNLFKL